MKKTKETEILYHYCSLATLLSIISNEKLWFSDLLESNDKLEDIYLVKLFFEYIKEKRHKYDQTVIDNFFIGAQRKTAIYGISLTEARDSFYHWKTYANNNGVCIGFYKEKMNEFAAELKVFENKKICLNKVSYIDGYSRVETLFKSFIANASEQDPINCYEELVEHSPFYKEKNWEKEKEYRIVVRNFIEKMGNPTLPPLTYRSKKCQFNYVFKGDNPVFHYEIPIQLDYIKEIILSPLSTLTAEKLLGIITRANDNIKEDTIEIHESRIGVEN